MSQVPDFLECHCSCHDRGVQAFHIVPCCENCPHCDTRIKSGLMDDHVREAHPQLSEQTKNEAPE